MSGLINWLRDFTDIYSLRVNKSDDAIEVEVWAGLFGIAPTSEALLEFAKKHELGWVDVTLDLEVLDQEKLYANLLETSSNSDSGRFIFTSDKNLLPNVSIDTIIKYDKHDDDAYQPWFGCVFTNNLNDTTFYTWIDKEGDIRIIYVAEKVSTVDPTEQLKEWMKS